MDSLPDSLLLAAPAGYHSPMSAEALLAEEGRAQRVGQLRQLTGVDEKLFATLYLEPVRACAALMQQFPASERDCHARLGGLLDMTLDSLVFALKHRKAYMLPLNSDVESQSRQTEVWTAATAYSVLLSFLPVLGYLQVEYESGAAWHPLQGPLVAPYRFRFVTPTSVTLPERTGLLLGTQFLPSVVPAWFSCFPELYRSFLAVLVGDNSQSGMLEVLVQNGRQEAEKQWWMCHPQLQGTGTAAQAPVMTTFRQGIPASGVLPTSTPLSPVAVPTITAQNPASNTVMVSVPGTSAPTEPQVSAPTTLLACDVLLTAQMEVVEEDADTEESTPTLSVVRTEEETLAISSSLALLLPNSAEGTLDKKEGAPLLQSGDCVGSPTSSLSPGTGTAESAVPGGWGEQASGLAGQFYQWLSDGLQQQAITVNAPNASVHLVAGYVFIQVPRIFMRFLSEHLAEKGRHWSELQAQFDALAWHKVTPERLCHCQLFEEKNGVRFSRLSGYVIPTSRLFGDRHPPNNNPLMKITTKR